MNQEPLKDIMRSIILVRGSKSIEQALRQHGLPIGIIKADSRTQTMIEAGLMHVEGWANQHTYLFVPPTIAAV